MQRSLVQRLRPWWSLAIPEHIADEKSQAKSRSVFIWAAIFAGLFVVVYLLFVCTYSGQRWDDSAWFGFKVQDGDFLLAAKNQLRQISLPTLVAMSALLCLVAWIRWGLRTAMAVGLFLVVTLGVAELLKHYILPRPHFYDFEPLAKAHNTLPSGHTTIGAMVAVGFVLVLPRQVRGIVTVLAFGYAASVGGSTLAAGWHRPSDAIAAYALVGFATMLVIGLMLRRGTARLLTRDELGPLRGWSIVFWIVPAITVFFTWLALSYTVNEWGLVSGTLPITQWSTSQRDSAFTAGLLADYAAAGVLFTLLYLIIRRVDFGISRDAWRQWLRQEDAKAAFERLPDEAVKDTELPTSHQKPSSSTTQWLPTTTQDESSIGWGDRDEDSDRFYLEQRPPHYED